VGFINPVLYANPWALNDVKKGGNRGCGTSGFRAVTGWDPVTGLGMYRTRLWVLRRIVV
jgi:tripeptidyl-peptidase-1